MRANAGLVAADVRLPSRPTQETDGNRENRAPAALLVIHKGGRVDCLHYRFRKRGKFRLTPFLLDSLIVTHERSGDGGLQPAQGFSLADRERR
jgi:hypothetical protein